MINLKLLKENLEFIWGLPYLSNLLLFLCAIFVLVGTILISNNSNLVLTNKIKTEFTIDKNYQNLYFDKSDVKAIYYDNNDGIPESIIYTDPIDVRITIDDLKSSKIPVYVIMLTKKK